jgi:hypothetical protein
MKLRGLILLKNRFPFCSSANGLFKLANARAITTFSGYNKENENSKFYKWTIFGIVGGLGI